MDSENLSKKSDWKRFPKEELFHFKEDRSGFPGKPHSKFSCLKKQKLRKILKFPESMRLSFVGKSLIQKAISLPLFAFWKFESTLVFTSVFLRSSLLKRINLESVELNFSNLRGFDINQIIWGISNHSTCKKFPRRTFCDRRLRFRGKSYFKKTGKSDGFSCSALSEI